MQSIKFKSNKTIKIGDDIYKPYLVGNLPPRFGFKSNQTAMVMLKMASLSGSTTKV